MLTNNKKYQFHDFLPLMAEKLGGDGLIDEMCKGFQLLMDRDKGVITFDSLKKSMLDQFCLNVMENMNNTCYSRQAGRESSDRCSH
ncbi:putative EF-hand domain pair protein [Helianthus anomalus]